MPQFRLAPLTCQTPAFLLQFKILRYRDRGTCAGRSPNGEEPRL